MSEIKEEVDNLRKIDTLSKQESFKQVFSEMLTSKQFQAKDILILDITAVSQTEYTFLILHRILRLRFRIEGFFISRTGKVTIKKIEEVFSTRTQELKVP